MGLFKGGALRLIQTALYAITFACSAIILGFYSYFLASNTSRNYISSTRWKAVEGLAGCALIYSAFAILLTCCLGGVTIFAVLGLLLDVAFIGAMIAVAVLTRDGAKSCSTGNFITTPIGSGTIGAANGGFDGNIVYAVSLKSACHYNSACFAVAIIAAIIFLFTAIMQVFLSRHHKKEKRYGPGPKNNYTSGAPKRKFWQRKPKHAHDTELGATRGTAGGLAVPATHHNDRASHETGYTGSTVGGAAAYDKNGNPVTPATGHNHVHPEGHNHAHPEGHNHPHGGEVNPYGYSTPATKAYVPPGQATNY